MCCGKFLNLMKHEKPMDPNKIAKAVAIAIKNQFSCTTIVPIKFKKRTIGANVVEI